MDILEKKDFETIKKILQSDIKLPTEIEIIVPIILDTNVPMKKRAIYATKLIDWIRYMDTVVWQFDKDFTEWKKELYESSIDN